MTSPLFDLSGKVAIVSGAASGLGKAAALALAAHGADLLLADLNEAGLKATADEIQKTGRKVAYRRTDVSDADEIQELFTVLDHQFGRIDFLANIAGEGILGKPEEMPLTTVQQVFQNLVFGRPIHNDLDRAEGDADVAADGRERGEVRVVDAECEALVSAAAG